MDAPTLDFAGMTDDDLRLSLRKYSIGLTVEEARKVQEMLGRAPTVVEAVIWGIQGSEHCSYKSSRRFLKGFTTSGKHVILGPGEDSGVVAITDGPKGKRWGIVVSHESHNKPSQVVPFEGAATGVGGCVRDVACMGARVIGSMDMLRLGDPQNQVSLGIAKEVVRGVAGYANPLGVPNLGGDTVFDSAYDAQCLVNVVSIGIVREDEIIHSYVPEEAAKEKYDIILVGKPTDRSGFGGAAFASVTIDATKQEENTGAVQEPNPFLERHILISTYALFDWIIANGHLSKVSFKDLGAGGVVCSSVEQVAGRGFGAEVDLDKVHVSLPDLPSEVIACAETQERFCWACHPSLTEAILKHYNETWDLPSVAEGACASVIGYVTGDGIYRLRHKGVIVCEAKSTDITEGLQYTRPTSNPDIKRSEPSITCNGTAVTVDGFKTTIADAFKAMLTHPNYASRWPVIRKYDKTVIGNGVVEAGEGDSSVVAPLRDLPSYVPGGGTHPGWENDPALGKIGAAFGSGGNARYGRVSAKLQGAHAALEAMCNVVASGATPRSLTDCLNYGNPEVPEQLGALEHGVEGIKDAAAGFSIDGETVPVISGNVSLYNGARGGSPIPPSAIVCCIGAMPDVNTALTMQLQKAGSSLYLLGARKDECGASAYYEVLESMAGKPKDSLLGASVPNPSYPEILAASKAVLAANAEGMLLSCHDVSEGGMLLALFEMTTKRRKAGGKIGVRVETGEWLQGLRTDAALFSQTPGFVVEVSAEHVNAFEKIARGHGIEPQRIGVTTGNARFIIDTVMDEPLEELHGLWGSGLEKMFS